MKKYIFISLIVLNCFISSAFAQMQEYYLDGVSTPFNTLTNFRLYDYDTVRNKNFDNICFRHIVVESGLNSCTFKNCVFERGWIYAGGDVNDFTNAYFAPYCQVYNLYPKSFVKTKNYALKNICFPLKESDYDNFDFSDFTISSFFRVTTKGAKFHNTWFKNAKIPKYLTQEQIKQTKNYQTGVFHGISFWEFDSWELESNIMMKEQNLKPQQIFQNLDISGMTFSFCELYGSFSGTNMTDTVFTESDLSTVEDLTLEQVKSTWNYKAGRMSLCKWPEYIEKALEEEEKAKAQEEKK